MFDDFQAIFVKLKRKFFAFMSGATASLKLFRQKVVINHRAHCQVFLNFRPLDLYFNNH